MVQTVFAPDEEYHFELLWRDINPEQLMDSKLKCVFELPPEQNEPGEEPHKVSPKKSAPTTAGFVPSANSTGAESELEKAAAEVINHFSSQRKAHILICGNLRCKSCGKSRAAWGKRTCGWRKRCCGFGTRWPGRSRSCRNTSRRPSSSRASRCSYWWWAWPWWWLGSWLESMCFEQCKAMSRFPQVYRLKIRHRGFWPFTFFTLWFVQELFFFNKHAINYYVPHSICFWHRLKSSTLIWTDFDRYINVLSNCLARNTGTVVFLSFFVVAVF